MNIISNYPEQTDRVGTKIIQDQRSRTVLREDKSGVLITTDGKHLYVGGMCEVPPYDPIPKSVQGTDLYKLREDNSIVLGKFDRGANTLVFEAFPKLGTVRYYLASEVEYTLIESASASMLCLADRPVVQIGSRVRGDEEFPLVRNQDIDDALHTMLYCDFDFGAGLQRLDPKCVTTVTRVMGCIDVATYYGNIDILVKAARAFLAIKQEGNTDYVNHLGLDVKYSNKLSRGVLLRAFPELREVGPKFFTAELKDVCTAVVMLMKREVSITDISDLL